MYKIWKYFEKGQPHACEQLEYALCTWSSWLWSIFSINRSSQYTKGLLTQFFKHIRNEVTLNNFEQVSCWRMILVLLLRLTHSFPNAPILYTLKTSEERKVFWCFQGVEKEWERVKCNSIEKDVHNGRTQKADTKIIAHMKFCLLNSCRNVVVKIDDTDVITS